MYGDDVIVIVIIVIVNACESLVIISVSLESEIEHF